MQPLLYEVLCYKSTAQLIALRKENILEMDERTWVSDLTPLPS